MKLFRKITLLCCLCFLMVGCRSSEMNKYEPIWEDSFNDSINGINSIDDANEIKIFINGEYTNEVPSVFKKSNDNKNIFVLLIKHMVMQLL